MTSRSTSLPLGIDVGGSGIKGAPVDLETGEFAAERVRIPTPEDSTPEAVADVIAQGDASSSAEHRARGEAARAIRLLLETVDDRTIDVRRSMGPGVLTAMHLRRILILSGTPARREE